MMKDLEENGFYKIGNIISKEWIEKLNLELPIIFDEHEKIRRSNNNPIVSKGIAMNAIIGNKIFFDFLNHLIDIKLIHLIEDTFFKTGCILNSLSALSNIKEEDAVFHKKIHRDIRGFSAGVPIMLNMLIMLDDFTFENGATHLYAKSHLEDYHDIKSESFLKRRIIATGNSGDVLIWNSNLYHASGVNTTDNQRRALALTFSLPYYKQLIDYPRAIGETDCIMSLELKKLLGYHSRVPSSLEEWYAPVNKISYKK